MTKQNRLSQTIYMADSAFKDTGQGIRLPIIRPWDRVSLNIIHHTKKGEWNVRARDSMQLLP